MKRLSSNPLAIQKKKVLKMLAEWNSKKKKVKRSSAFWLLQRALHSSVQISAN
jgi:hypothetical protein